MTDNQGASQADEGLEQVLAGYLRSIEKGQPLDRQQLIDRHPELADDLRSFFRNRDAIEQLAEPIQEQAPTIGLDTEQTGGGGGRVRYFGDYELVEEIARGGMGVVYKARQVSLNRIVALKMILAGQLASEADVQRFHTEAEAAANLDHPGIVPIYEVGVHENQHYFSMGYIEGQSLAEKVAAGPLPADEAAEIVNKVADAVDYAHRQGVIHRDLKPANILLASVGRQPDDVRQQSGDPRPPLAELTPKITDFGLAKQVGGSADLTATGQVLGTPSYMPPEQAAGKPDRVKETADVYALGAILYTLLTGRPPFQAANPIDTLAQVLSQEPASPRLLDPAIPRDLETICLKCLEKEPYRRYQAASELADDLQRYLGDEPIHARPIGNMERLGRWARRQRRSVALTMAAAAVSAILVVGGLLVWYSYQQWRLGQVTFLTTSADSPHLVGEVLDKQGQSVSGLFTVPMQKPMELPSDSYRLRLSGAGRLSQDFQFVVGRDRQRRYELHLNDTQLWSTLQVERTYALADLEGRADVILFNDTGFSRLNGSSCRELWSVDLSNPGDPVFAEAPGFRWSWPSDVSYSGRGKFDRRPQLVSPAPDLNGDGIGDLVWAARTQSWLLAASGKDGKILWLAGRGQDTREVDDQAGRTRYQVTGTVLGVPSVVDDLDGDGTSDLLATFADKNPAEGRRGQNEPLRWIEAISGATGRPVWRFDLEDRLFQLPSGVETPADFRWTFSLIGSEGGGGGGGRIMGRHWYRRGRSHLRPPGSPVCVPDAPRVVRSGGREVVLVVAGTHVIGLDLSSGQPVWPPHDLGFPPICAARQADLDGDAEPDLILVGPSQSAQGQTPSDTLRLVAWSIATKKTLWDKKITAVWRLHDLPQCAHPEWPIAADLDGDGRREVIVPNGSSSAAGGNAWPWGALEVLDGATGQTRWRKEVITMDQHLERFTVGPDVDADGHADIFVATVCRQDDRNALYIDALSGKDGHRLWWANAPLGHYESHFEEPYVGSVRFWDADARPWPQLLVTVFSLRRHTSQRSAPDLFVFSSATGRLDRVGIGMENLQLADGDGDGRSDLYSFRPVLEHNTDHGGKLDALRGLPTETWRCLGREWTVAADFNGDGDSDLLEIPRWSEVAARSGRDGKLLWRAGGTLAAEAGAVGLQDDLDGDGCSDALLYDNTSGNSAGGLRWPLHAISGRTGKVLWSVDAPIRATAGSLFAESRDLGGDGRPEIIYAAANDWAYPASRRSYSSSDAEPWLAVISAHDGKILWKQSLAQAAGTGRGLPYEVDYGLLHPAYADLNDDGTLDILLPAEATAAGDQLELRAFSGTDGKVLWKRGLAPPINPRRLLQDAPLVATGDLDGDIQPEVVVCEFFEKKGGDSDDRYHARVFVLDGADGKRKGPAWETKAGSGSRLFGSNDDPRLLNRPAPQLLARGKEKAPAIALTFWGIPGEAVVLEPDGRVITRFPLKGTKAYVGSRAHMWDGHMFSADVTGNGCDELIFASEGEVRAIRPGVDEPLWRWLAPTSQDHAEGNRFYSQPNQVFDRQTLGPFDVEILDLLPAGENRSHVVAVRCGNLVYGLSGAEGRQLWSSAAGRHRGGFRSGQLWFAPTMRLLPTADGQTPRIVSEFPNKVIVCRQVRPTDQDSALALAQPEPAVANLARDPRYLRFLPWASGLEGEVWWVTIRNSLWGAILLVVLVVLPGTTLLRLIRHRRWTMRTMFLLPVLLALAITVLTVDLPFASRHMRTVGGRFAWALAVTPTFALPALLVYCTYRREWRRLVRWLVILMGVTMLMGGFLLIAENSHRPLDASEHYAWDGWYLLWLMGAYLTGVLTIVALVGHPVIKLVWRRLRSSLEGAKPV